MFIQGLQPFHHRQQPARTDAMRTEQGKLWIEQIGHTPETKDHQYSGGKASVQRKQLIALLIESAHKQITGNDKKIRDSQTSQKNADEIQRIHVLETEAMNHHDCKNGKNAKKIDTGYAQFITYKFLFPLLWVASTLLDKISCYLFQDFGAKALKSGLAIKHFFT
jgi:hypothetical protein